MLCCFLSVSRMKPYALHSKTKLTAASYNNYASYLQLQFEKTDFFQLEFLYPAFGLLAVFFAAKTKVKSRVQTSQAENFERNHAPCQIIPTFSYLVFLFKNRVFVLP